MREGGQCFSKSCQQLLRCISQNPRCLLRHGVGFRCPRYCHTLFIFASQVFIKVIKQRGHDFTALTVSCILFCMQTALKDVQFAAWFTLSSMRRCVTSAGSIESSSGYFCAMRTTHCSEHRSRPASRCSRSGSCAQENHLKGRRLPQALRFTM